jgi:pimeloyl-ACP methyl ester carboxylesterase
VDPAPRTPAAPAFPGHHEEWGAGEPLLLLHAGYCSLEPMRELGDLLSRHVRVLAAERPGHGRTPDHDGPYSYARMVDVTLAYLDALGVPSAHVVGHSDGGIVGLLLARDHPDRVRSLVAVSANISTDAWVPADYPHVTLTDEANAAVDAEYARLSPDGPEHAAVVVDKLVALWRSEPDITAGSLAAVRAPTLVMAGEHDTVAREHTASIAAAVPGAGLTIVPGTTHMVVRERTDVVAEAVLAHVRSAAGRAGRPA